VDLGLRDRACVVTGASRGIGQATALVLAAEGASVLLIGRDRDALEAVAARCRPAPADLLALDVTDGTADMPRMGQFPPLQGEHIATDHLAPHAGTIPYAILTRLPCSRFRAYR